MINKFKDIGRRGLSLGLAISMMMPTGVYAGNHSVGSWDGYKNALITDIMKQDTSIIINFSGNEIFSTEDTAHSKIDKEFSELISELPRQYGQLNINNSEVKRYPTLIKNADNSYKIKDVRYEIKYYNDNIRSIKKHLEEDELFDDIKSQRTTYDKVKTAYYYVLENLDFYRLDQSEMENHNIDDGISNGSKVSADAYSVLFAIIMDELGYENEIVVGSIRNGKDRHVWNLVEVQGKWYHVDTRLGDVGNNGYKYLLTSDEFMENSEFKHAWANDDRVKDIEAGEKYDPNNKFKYEIDFIKASIGANKEEINKIDITLNNINDKNIQLESIKDKAKAYENSIDVLKKDNDVSLLIGELKGLNNLITVLEDLLLKIDSAIKAVEKVEDTKLKTDFDIADDLVKDLDDGPAAVVKSQLSGRLSAIKREVDARAAVKEAEDILLDSTLDTDQEVNQAVNSAYNNAIVARELVQKLAENSDVKNVLESTISDIIKVRGAKNTIASAEKDDTITIETIQAAKDSLNQINAKYALVKKNLSDRIVILENLLKESEEAKIISDADAALNILESILDTTISNAWPTDNWIPDGWSTEEWSTKEWTLENVALAAEYAIELAEEKINQIVDRDTKKAYTDSIKEMELVIKAIRAVDKAETEPLKATNIKSARTAIAKVSREYKVEMDALEVRLVLVEFKINSQSAIKLIEKAESSLKRADYNKAKAAVDKLIEGEMGEGYDPGTYTGSYRDLVLRLEDVEYVILAKEAVENAEKLMNANRETLDVYEKAIADVRTIYNTSLDDYDEGFNKKFGSLLTDLNNRISAMDDAIKAMKDLSLTEQIYQGYLAKENTPRKVRELIDRTEKAINDLIESNNSGKLNSRVISSLQSRLKVVSDGLSEDEKYYEVSLLLESLEKSIIDTQGGLKQEAGKTLEETIATIDQEMTKIIEATNDVKNKARKKDIQDRTTAINNVLAAYRAVEVAEKSDIKNLSTNIKKANTAVGKLSTDGIYENIENIGQYIKVLENRISKKEKAVETADNVAKAIAAVDKAEMTKNEKDTKGAIDAVAKLKGNPEVEDIFTDQKNQIRDIISDLIEIANDAVNTTISSIRRKNDNKLVNKNYTNASKAIGLADNITYQASTLLEIIQDKTGEPYELQIKNLDEILSVLDLSLEALRAVEEAEKNRTQSNVDLANEAIKLIPNEDESVEPKKYKEMKEALKARVDYVYSLLESQRTLESTANNLIAQAEELMINYLDAREVPKDLIMRQAQEAVNGVTDKSKKADFQKRINNINSAMLAISAVDFAKGFTDEKTVKDAEKALSNLVKTGSYLDIATDLNSQIGQLKDKLNIEKLVADAEELVLKAIKSRTIEDIRRAEFALVRIKEHDEAAHDRLFVMLTELNESLGKEAEDEIAATEAAKKAIADARDLINGSDEVEGVNGLVLDIIASIKELRVAIKDKDKDRENYVKVLLQEAYGKTKAASDLISKAGYEVLKLSNKNNQKTLQEQIKFVNEEIALAEDNIDVQEATRLLTIASYLVAEAKTEQDRHMAGLAIGDTRRAINDIGHKKNSDVKKTIIAQANSIEKRLSINNDEVFIAEAVDAVNKAADELANSVIANKVTENQRDIEMAIWDAELAIILISDNNREAKEMLKSFLNDISVMFEAEKAGIQNAQRIINAEEAVEYAEKEYEAKSDKVEAAIRTARLRIRMIRTDGQDAEEAIAKIEELTSRLDRLEGKTGGSGGNGSDGKKPVGNSNSKAPDSDYARVKENTDPLWGGSKKLNKTNPTPDTTNSEMIELRIKDSKVSIVDAAKKLKTTKNLKVSLVAKGRNIDSGASAYRLDSVNNNILLPIMPLAKGLGFSVEMDGGSTSTRLIINTLVNGESKRATINMNTARYYVDGRSISVKTKPILEDGIAYIPIDFLVEYLGLSFSHYIQGSNIQMIIN